LGKTAPRAGSASLNLSHKSGFTAEKTLVLNSREQEIFEEFAKLSLGIFLWNSQNVSALKNPS